jgi:hypothetical protein
MDRYKDKGNEGELFEMDWFTNVKQFETILNEDEYGNMDFEIKYQDKLVAVMDAKNKVCMDKRPAQGINLYSFIMYICKASLFKVPALVTFKDDKEGINRMYTVDLTYLCKLHLSEIKLRQGTQQRTGKKLLQVEVPLRLCGTLKDMSGTPCNIPALNNSSTTVYLTALKQGVYFPDTVTDIDGTEVQSRLCKAKRIIRPEEILDMLLKELKEQDKAFLDKLLKEFISDKIPLIKDKLQDIQRGIK